MIEFEDNKYTKWYFNIIEKAKSELRIKNKQTYFEKHHIIPKCVGGNDENSNLILLTPREHFMWVVN